MMPQLIPLPQLILILMAVVRMAGAGEHPEFMSDTSKHFVTFRPYYSQTMPNEGILLQLQQPLEFRNVLNILASAKDKEAELIKGKSIKSFLLLNEFGPPFPELCHELARRFLEHKQAAQGVKSLVDYVDMCQGVMIKFCEVISKPLASARNQ